MRTPRERIDAYRRAYEAQSTEDCICAIDAARWACFQRMHMTIPAAHAETWEPVLPRVHEWGARHLYEAVSELWRWACIEAIFGRAQ